MEVKEACKKGTYMGIWQIFALVSVLQVKLFSVYLHGISKERKSLSKERPSPFDQTQRPSNEEAIYVLDQTGSQTISLQCYRYPNQWKLFTYGSKSLLSVTFPHKRSFG